MEEFLSEEERERLRDVASSETYEKLESLYKTMRENLSRMEAERKSDRVNREQLFNQLEQRFVNLKNESAERERDVQGLREELEESKRSLAKRQKDIEDREKQLREEQSVSNSLKLEIDQIRAEKNDAVLMSARREDSIKSLREDLTDSQKRCEQLNVQKREATKSERQAKSDLQSTQFEVEKLRRETELSKKHQSWLDSELERQSNELLSSRKEASEELLSLRSQLDQSLSREKQMGQKLDTVTARNVEMDKRVEELLRKIKSTSDEHSSRDEEWKKEMETQRELTRMYQAKCVQSEKENAELNADIEESKSLIAEMERQSSVRDGALQSQIRELRSERNKLSEEKDEIKKILESTQGKLRDAEKAVEKLSADASQNKSSDEATTSNPPTPRVASASNLLRSPLGDIPGATPSSSMTEWYDRVVRAEEQLVKEQRAREKTEAYLEQVLKEIEEKAPIISQNRRDYERALQQHSVLSRRLTTALERNENLERRLGESLKSRERAVGEAKALKKTIQDLSRQVQVLLWRSHSMTSSSSSSPPMTPSASSTNNGVFETPSPRSLLKSADDDSLNVKDADSIISDRLVTFSTVQQLHVSVVDFDIRAFQEHHTHIAEIRDNTHNAPRLQQVRNQQLLRVVRRLSQKHESYMQSKATEESEYKNVLASKFRKELGEMRAARQRQEAMVAEVVRQRDMYKDLLSKQKQKPRVAAQMTVQHQEQQEQPQVQPQQHDTTMMMTQIETQAAMSIEREIKRLKTELNESKEELRSYRQDTSKSASVLQSSLDESRSETFETSSRSCEIKCSSRVSS